MKFFLPIILSFASVSAVTAGADLLSELKDVDKDDPAASATHKNEPSAFWGMGTMLGGGGKKGATVVSSEDQLKAIRKFADKNEGFFNAAALLSAHGSSLIGTLTASKDKEDTKLAAAALAIKALTGYMTEQRGQYLIEVEHLNTQGQPIGKKGKGKKPKNPKKKKGAAPVRTSVPPELLQSRDADTLFYAIQAAAYGRDASVADAVKAVADKNTQIMAVKILYRAMIGEEIPAAEVAKTAQRCMTGARSARGVPPPDFNLDNHGMTFICQAIGELKNEAYLPILDKAIAMNDIRIQMDAARAMRAIGSPKSLRALAATVPRCQWPVLVEVCAALAEVPHKAVFPIILKRLEKEKGRMRLDLTYVLCSIAGGQQAKNKKGWAAWWAQNGKTFTVDAAASEAFRAKTRVQDVEVPGLGFFYGLSIYSDRMCYVIDSSASMRGARIESLKENLSESIKLLNDVVMFNLIDFGGDIEALYEGALTDNKKNGMKRVEEMDLSLATRSFCSMRQGMILDEVDTIFFLSDGAPARDSMRSWAQIQDAILTMNRYCPVAMFCIDFDPSAGNQAAMIKLADWNYGLHESIDVN